MHEHTVITKSKGVERGRKTIMLADTLEDAKELVGEEKAVKLFNMALTTTTRKSLVHPNTPSKRLIEKVATIQQLVTAGVDLHTALNALQVAQKEYDNVVKQEQEVL